MGSVGMPKIEWDESFSVHNAEIDGQHKKWIELFNKTHNILMKSDIEASLDPGIEAIKAMQDYACYHFKFEEEYMRTMNYPDFFNHKRLHKDFDDKIYSYSRLVHEGKLVSNTEILKLIRNWLLDHITIEDKKFAQYFETKNNP